MNEIKFEVGKTYDYAKGKLKCIERTEETVTFQLVRTGAKHTLKTYFSGEGVEYACLGFRFFTALIGE